MKSFLSLERSATFICRKAGVERKYLVYEGAEFVNYDLLYKKPTEESNGVIAELVIKDYNEFTTFKAKARAKLAYYDTAVLVIDGMAIDNKIYRNKLFQWSTEATTTQMHICLKDVYYAIDWEALGIRPLDFAVALRFELGDGLTPTPSRESYITNDKTKELILNRIRDVSEWFVDKYNNKIKNFKDFKSAYSSIMNSNYFVDIETKSFHINCLVPFSKTKIAEPTVAGIKLKTPSYYKRIVQQMFVEYRVDCYLNSYGNMRYKYHQCPHIANHTFSDGEVVIVDSSFVGNVRLYIKNKYKSNVLFVSQINKRKLGAYKAPILDSTSYHHVLGLKFEKKDKWRALITEFDLVVSSITSTFHNETGVASSKVFLDWQEDRRDAQKKLRELNKTKVTTYGGLNKGAKDITMAYAYNSMRGMSFGKKVAYPVSSLLKPKVLTIIVDPKDDIELAKKLAHACAPKHIQFALVGPLEAKKIPKSSNYINLKQFMSKESKPFARIASAIKFQSVLKKYDEIKNFKSATLAPFLKDTNAIAKELSDYVKENLSDSTPEEVKASITNIADKQKLYDYRLWDKYLEVKKIVDDYGFAHMLNLPAYASTQVISDFKTLVYQIMLSRKKHRTIPAGVTIVLGKDEVGRNVTL